MKGWNIYGTEQRLYKKGRGDKYRGRRHACRWREGDIHGKESIQNGSYKEKDRRELGEREHIQKGDTYGEGTHGEEIHGKGRHTEKGHMEKGQTRRGDILRSGDTLTSGGINEERTKPVNRLYGWESH